MCAGCDPGPVCEYQWADGVTFKKALTLLLLCARSITTRLLRRVLARESERTAVLQLLDGLGAAAAGRRSSVSLGHR